MRTVPLDWWDRDDVPVMYMICDVEINGLGLDQTTNEELLLELDAKCINYAICPRNNDLDFIEGQPFIRTSSIWLGQILIICGKLFSNFFELSITPADMKANHPWLKEDDTEVTNG